MTDFRRAHRHGAHWGNRASRVPRFADNFHPAEMMCCAVLQIVIRTKSSQLKGIISEHTVRESSGRASSQSGMERPRTRHDDWLQSRSIGTNSRPMHSWWDRSFTIDAYFSCRQCYGFVPFHTRRSHESPDPFVSEM